MPMVSKYWSEALRAICILTALNAALVSSETVFTRIDNTDDTIAFIGPWANETDSQCFNGTYAYANETGTSLSYSFEGTQISVYAVIPTSNFTHVVSTNFSIDGGAPIQYAAFGNPVYNAYSTLFYSSPPLEFGTAHTLTLTVMDTALNEGHGLWLDFFQVEGAYGSTTGLQTTKTDDTDPSVQYISGSWFHNIDTSTVPPPFNSTDTMSKKQGDALKYTFRGTQLAVFGVTGAGMNSSAFTASFSIGSEPATNVVGASVPNTTVTRAFYTSPVLDYGNHTLELFNQEDDGWIWIDYFEVFGNQSASTTDGSDSVPSSSRNLSANAIAGIAIGPTLALAAIALAFWYYKQRWRHRKRYEYGRRVMSVGILADPEEGKAANAAVDPFIFTAATTTSDTYSHGKGFSASSMGGLSYQPPVESPRREDDAGVSLLSGTPAARGKQDTLPPAYGSHVHVARAV